MTKNKKIILFAISVVLLLIALFALNQSTEHRTKSNIYSQIIAYRPRPKASAIIDRCKDNGIFFSSKTNKYPILMHEDWQETIADLPQIQSSTWENLIEVNSESSPFPKNLPLGCAYKVLDAKNDENEYMSVCPIYMFSEIGFNEDKSQAIAYLSSSCGGWSSGDYYLLNLIDGRWQVVDTMIAHYLD